PFPLLHVIDLDAALGKGDNRELVRYLLSKARARVGGGVRSIGRAAELTELGAEQVIVGTSAFLPNGINRPFLEPLAQEIGKEKVVVAIDVKGGRIAVKGWQQALDLKPEDVLRELEPYCAGFLCTYVDREGMMAGTNLPFFLNLRRQTDKTLIAAGGITTLAEVRTLVQANIQVALGMAVYTGRLNLSDLANMMSQSG
ncbi:MAG TPA: HisA/HisF-related TIM barrel protein, partial [Fimbriimonadaceae bacterium]|nr:HisA/HisF-related TIM barrel protein [Fimbriimonadaceae bacterium]